LPRTETEKFGAAPALAGVARAIARTRACLLGLQNPAGYWKGRLEADASVSAGYIPLVHFLGLKPEAPRLRKIIDSVRKTQNADGSWSAYAGGPGDISVTAQVYFALKLAGVSAEADYMRRACRFVTGSGGLMKANLITRIMLALFGEFSWKGIPTIPPEIVFLPNWFYFNIYECSSWARATIMALAILTVRRPVCGIPESARVVELYAEPEERRRYATGTSPGLFRWETFFLAADRLLKLYEKLPLKPLRGLALRQTVDWVVRHQEADGSWGGIMLPWVYSLFALKCLGYPLDHPVMKKGIAGLEGFIVEDGGSFLLEPATSPVWDTAWAVLALRESGLPDDHAALTKAAGWLVSKEIREKGDWCVKNPRAKSGCWSFEFENRWYPDIDDTAVVPRALRAVKLPTIEEEKSKDDAVRRGIDWALAMQGDEGGWAAFDRNNNRAMLAHIPFSDFMTPLDPVSPDVTNHIIELLCQFQDNYVKEIKRGLAYLKKSQEPDGAWYGRWGVNYLYGTGLVLPALKAAGEDMSREYIRKAVKWLEDHQNPDGGWGESCRSYDEPGRRGQGGSTASQTAWALMGLLAVGEVRGGAVRRGIEYLLETQRDDGSWREEAFTGTGFPRAFYLRYDLYRIYFPLMALARYRDATQEVTS
jgi:squalene-hopene/tetraprenyl-beta-curcumene cyclase